MKRRTSGSSRVAASSDAARASRSGRVSISLYLHPRRRHSPPGAAPDKPVEHYALAQAYGADPNHIAAVQAFARAHGLHVARILPLHRRMRLSGTPGELAPLLGAAPRIVAPRGKPARVLAGGPIRLPPELAPFVAAVFGLDDEPLTWRRVRLRPRAGADAGAAKGYRPEQVATKYKFPKDLTGAGQCIGLVSMGGVFDGRDLVRQLDDPEAANRIIEVRVDGCEPSSSAQGDLELALDVELAASVAPGAHIVIYHTEPTVRGLVDAISDAVHDEVNRPKVLALSWGAAEEAWGEQALAEVDRCLRAAARLGITVLAASGDQGESDGVTDAGVHVDFPASSPHVLACGGTTLGPPGTRRKEAAWGERTDAVAGGGGVSTNFTLPSWQRGRGVPRRATGRAGRGLPDVAAHADPVYGYRITLAGRERIVGGTSAVPPLLAGLIACINEARGAAGPVGFFLDRLYGAADSTFTSIAEPGWDPRTGLGRPIGDQLLTLLRDAAATTERRPAKAKPIDTNTIDAPVLLATRAVSVDAGQVEADLHQLTAVGDWIRQQPMLVPEGTPTTQWPPAGVLYQSEAVRLHTRLCELSRQLTDLRVAIDGVLQHWNNLAVDYMVSGLTDCTGRLGEIESQAAGLKVDGADIGGSLERRSTSFDQQSADANARQVQADKDVQAAFAARDAVYRSMEGSSGFLKGFITGITLGIKNEIKEAQDEADQQYNAALAANTAAQVAASDAARTRHNAEDARAALARLASVDASVTTIQNDFIAALSAAEKAAQDAKDLVDAAGLAAFWRARLNADMDTLGVWESILERTFK